MKHSDYIDKLKLFEKQVSDDVDQKTLETMLKQSIDEHKNKYEQETYENYIKIKDDPFFGYLATIEYFGVVHLEKCNVQKCYECEIYCERRKRLLNIND